MKHRPHKHYPGGKGAAGVFQTIIALMPEHRLYVEPFLGGGRVLLNKRPAERSMGIDVDPEVVKRWQRFKWPGLTIIEADALAWLERWKPPPRTLLYVDPPYVVSTRTKKRLYARELTDADHRRLLRILKRMHCHVIISGYDSALYRRQLRKGWHARPILNMTRGGPRREYVWCNFVPGNGTLHDTRWFGSNYRDRTRIKRKAARWALKFEALPIGERQTILAAMAAAWIDHQDATPKPTLRPGRARNARVGAAADPKRRKRHARRPAARKRSHR